MAAEPNPRTILHLVPVNERARDTLTHPDNRRFVSNSAAEEPGLEIGFHVPNLPAGRVITRLGRQGDLTLRGRTVSAVHVAFEIHPVTYVVVLSIRSKHGAEVRAKAPGQEDWELIPGDCVLTYNEGYSVDIASHEFFVSWRLRPGDRVQTRMQDLRDFTFKEYQDSLKRSHDINSRYLATETDESEFRSWHITRVHSSRTLAVHEVKEFRILIGSGSFGKVYKSVDRASGHAIAVKEILLDGGRDGEIITAAIHREIKALERCKHAHIIDYLGVEGWNTNAIKVYMPLRDGSLSALASSKASPEDSVCREVLFQMLQALDFLACRRHCHRDVKPENILYTDIGQGKYLFQLADFGLVNHVDLASTTCGTPLFMAPELFAEDRRGQTTKMDVWSLFATIAATHSNFDFPPPPSACKSYRRDILPALRRAAAAPSMALEPMGREDPDRRASAAQMLVALFKGKGLSTERGNVPPLDGAVGVSVAPQEAGPSNAGAREPGPAAQGGAKRGPGRRSGGRKRAPLIVYPPQPEPARRARGGGVKKQRAKKPKIPGSYPEEIA